MPENEETKDVTPVVASLPTTGKEGEAVIFEGFKWTWLDNDWQLHIPSVSDPGADSGLSGGLYSPRSEG